MITGSEAANDRIVINGLAGDDVIEASRAAAASPAHRDGGDGNDVLIGSAGNDVLTGRRRRRRADRRPGQDILDGGDGDDVEIN